MPKLAGKQFCHTTDRHVMHSTACRHWKWTWMPNEPRLYREGGCQQNHVSPRIMSHPVLPHMMNQLHRKRIAKTKIHIIITEQGTRTAPKMEPPVCYTHTQPLGTWECPASHEPQFKLGKNMFIGGRITHTPATYSRFVGWPHSLGIRRS